MNRLSNRIRNNRTLAAVLLLLLLAIVFLFRILIPPSGEVLGGYDMRGLFHVLNSAVSDAIRGGSLPLWNQYLFNGFPLFADPQAGVFYPINWLSIILPVNVGISWSLLAHLLIAGTGMFAFVRYLGSQWFPSLLSGVIFAFGGVLAGRLWAGHLIVIAVFAWTPWLLLALRWSVKTGSVWSSIIAGVPFGLAILAGHLPSFIYISMIWGAFILYLLITEKSRRGLVIRQALIMAITGIGISAIQLIPTIQLSMLSERADVADYEFATRFSFPPAHLSTLVVPEFFGEPLRIGYWSVPTFEELTYYAGILSLLLLAVALVKADRLTWFYVSLMVFGILLAMGSYGVLHRLLFATLPPIRLMRAPARAAFLFFFAASALVGHALTMWNSSSDEERAKTLSPSLRWLVTVLIVIGTLAIAATSAVFISVHPTDTSSRLWHQIGGIAFAITIVLICGGLLWFLLIRKPKDKRWHLVLMAALLAIVLVDLWTFSYKFVRTEPVGPDQLWLDAKEIIGETNAGVLPWGLSIFTQNGGMQAELRSVFGYNSLGPQKYLALASSIPDPRSSAYDVLGTEYVISEVSLDQFTEGDSGIELVDESSSVKVYRRPNSLPVVRILFEYEVIDVQQEAIKRVHSPDFDPSMTVILEKDPGCEISSGSGTAAIEENRHGYWKIKSQSDSPGILVLAENAYPGWDVRVDGENADSLQAYTTLKAVCVPAGDHTVEWSMTATILYAGLAVTITAVVLVIIAIFINRKDHALDSADSSDAE